MTKASKPIHTRELASTIHRYYLLTKPGIIRGNAFAALAGYFLAAQGTIRIGSLLGMLIGMSAIVASACVSNNYIDRDIDQHMKRTKQRALVVGSIPTRHALLFAGLLGILGVLILLLFTTVLTAVLGVAGYIAYVFVYTAAKRSTVHGTVIGSISGAIPPLAGYSTVHGTVDLAAILLFLIIILWQMPHFYTIAVFRLDEYKAAKIPVLPLVRSIRRTKFHIIWYVIAFTAAIAGLWLYGPVGYIYLICSGLVSLYWLWHALSGLRIHDTKLEIVWARQMFGISLLAMTVLCVAIAVDSFV